MSDDDRHEAWLTATVAIGVVVFIVTMLWVWDDARTRPAPGDQEIRTACREAFEDVIARRACIIRGESR